MKKIFLIITPIIIIGGILGLWLHGIYTEQPNDAFHLDKFKFDGQYYVYTGKHVHFVSSELNVRGVYKLYGVIPTKEVAVQWNTNFFTVFKSFKIEK